MPANPRSLQLEQTYHLRQRDLRRRVTALVASAGPSAVISGQRSAQLLAAAYLSAYRTLETGQSVRPRPIADFAGTTIDGRSVRDMAAFADPDRSRLVAETEVIDAGFRELANQSSGQRVIRGWTWVCFGDTCAACLSQMDGSVRSWNRPMGRHPGCDCESVPVFDVAPTVTRPTGEDIYRSMSIEEQTAVFKNAGDQRRLLIAAGVATLADFATEQHFRDWRPVITEQSLEAVEA